MQDMKESEIIKIGGLFNEIKIPTIDHNTNFWMVRSKSGYFYKEYTEKKFIAIAWNCIDKKSDFSRGKIDNLKELIRLEYGEKTPMTSINKCQKFIHLIKQGDFIVIPNKGSTEIAICRAGEYYEENLTVAKEKIAIRKIENKEGEIGTITCPYKKRRRIEVLLKVSANRINSKLLRGMSSYHGLNSLDNYAVELLTSIYDICIYGEEVLMAINVAKSKPIKARELSTFFHGVTELFSIAFREDDINVVVNLNSPGKLVISIKEKLVNKKNVMGILVLYGFVFGGSAFGLEFNGAAETILLYLKTIGTIGIEKELKAQELEGVKLDNYLKALEVYEAYKESGIDTEELEKAFEIIKPVSESLEFEANETFANDK